MAFIPLIALGLIGLAIVLILRGVSATRVRAAQTLGHIGSYGFTTPKAEERKRGPLTSVFDSVAGWLGDTLVRQLGRLEEKGLRMMLNGAGLYRISPRKFMGYRLLATVGAPALWLWVGLTSGAKPVIVVLGFLVSAICGWQLPITYVRRLARTRLGTIDYELPELIDLLVVTVEAGVGFIQSLQIAAQRLTGPLADELRLLLQEQAMGLAINEALRNMLARCDTPAVRSFVRSILQGETLGVSIGQIMRNLSTEMRKRRRAAAEERAQKAPLKLLFPLVFLIFQAMFVVLLAPAVLSFIDSVGGG